MLMVGACHILIPKFEAKSAFQAIEQHHVTSLITIPTMMADMIFTHRRQNRLSGGETVKKILNGGGGLSTELTEGATKIFPNAKLLSAYGMTEACSSLTFMTFQNLALQDSGKLLTKNFGAESGISYRPGGVRVGKPAPHVELQISSGNYKDGPFVVGRILTRGVHVMVGYWGQSLEIPSASDEHGWLDTGDIGWIDEYGDLWLVGRTKDRIKSGGENVYPEEVEAVISQHPGISDIVVIGVPDLRLTEMVVACVQIKDNWHWVTRNYRGPYGETEHFLSGEILQNYCKQKNLTRFKIPKKFLPWRESFPTTTTGKLRRDEVRRRAMSLVEFFPSNL
eukprot:TRINITY_DN4721_c0_g1_i1.p1 TRINITY_DN4721_c0_g1~~TRINITY_DN4721_c0_g1_i1.p1  ORF type:complete len:337 (+),score=48.63 TRINITY_DN4721_c0_g1_i1:114-1124(+)